MLGRLACEVGKGLVAGLIGTAAMSISSSLEMQVRKRKPGEAPAKAMEVMLGIQPTGQAAEARLATLTHWGYGTIWGIPRGLLGVMGVAGASATMLHLGMVWGTELLVLPQTGVIPPATEWGSREVAIDGFHHLVYATATGLAYGLLDREFPTGRSGAWALLYAAAVAGAYAWISQRPLSTETLDRVHDQTERLLRTVEPSW